MANRRRNQDNPGFDADSSALFSMSTIEGSRNAALSSHRVENEAPGTPIPMWREQPHSGAQSPKNLKSRQVIESLVAENSRLRVDLDTIQSRQNAIVTDLVKTKSELQAKDVELSSRKVFIKNQTAQLENLRHEVDNAALNAGQSDTHKFAEVQQTIHQLRMEIREKDLQLREKDQMLRERDFGLDAMKGQLEQAQKQRTKDELEMQDLKDTINNQIYTQGGNAQLDAETPTLESLQRELEELKMAHTTALSEIERGKAEIQQHLVDLTQYKATQNEAQSAIEAERAKSQQYFQEREQINTAHKQLQSRIDRRDTKTQKLTRELNDIQVSYQKTVAELKDKSQAQERLEASHANSLAEVHLTAKFFKKNSEASSRKAKELEAKVESLEQSLHQYREVEQYGTLNTSVHEARSPPLVGAWPDQDRMQLS